MRITDLALRLLGGTSGEQIVRAAAAASGAITLPAGTTDFSATGGTSQVIRQSTAGGAFTVGQLAAADVSGALTSSGVSGMTAGQIPIAATATTITSSGDLSGAVTTSGSLATTLANNAVATAHIANANVTYAKIQNVANNRLLGNTSGSAAAPAEIVLPLAAANGGTGLASGTSGGILYFNTTTSLASSALLTTNALIKGGGAGVAPIASTATVDAGGKLTIAGGLAVNNNTNPALSADTSYLRLFAPDVTTGAQIALGYATDPANYYSNGTHTFSNRAGTVDYASMTATGTTFGAPTGGAKGAGTINAIQIYENNVRMAPLASPVFTGDITDSGSLMMTRIDQAYAYMMRSSTAGFKSWAMTAGGAGAADDIYLSSTQTTVTGGMIVGSPTGGNKGVGTINAQVGVYANNVLLTSDARVKRDIGDLPEDCLSLVEQIQPKSFRFVEPDPPQSPDGVLEPPARVPPSFHERRHWGFTAQDMREALPEAVEEDEAGNLAISQGDLTAVLWRAVQELSAKVAALEGREPAA